MKKIITIILALSLGFQVFSQSSQTAANFSCNDCLGNNYNLFNELDAGQIVVICWVMPCGPCILPSTTAYNVVQSYYAEYPGKVTMYLCDDLGNNPCSAIDAWAVSNNLTKAIRFSDASIEMTPYGESGMPKVVVVAGTNHKVYDIQNDAVDYTQLIAAIDLAITETGIEKNLNAETSLHIFQNYDGQSKLLVNAVEPAKIQVSLYNYLGQEMTKIFSGNIVPGDNIIDINTSNYPKGIYFVRIKGLKVEKTLKLVVAE